MDVDDPFLQTKLDDWCQKAIVDQKHAVILLGVPADLEVAHIEETVGRCYMAAHCSGCVFT